MPSISPLSGTVQESWFASARAQRLVAAEQQELIPLLTSHIGVRGLFLRPTANTPGQLSGNMLQSVASVFHQRGVFAGDLQFAGDALPLGSDSLSLVYALHVLEQTSDGAALLDEIARCLTPEGLAVFIVLSPHSVWHWRARMPSRWSPASLRRAVEDSGLSVDSQTWVGPCWPMDPARAPRNVGIGAALLDPLRSSHVLVARKRRAGLTPLRKLRAVRLAAMPGQ